MAKKDKAKKNNEENFELQKHAPIIKPNGERDYFSEYYRTYKNDYIDQYLQAYKELKDIDAAISKVDKENSSTEEE